MQFNRFYIICAHKARLAGVALKVTVQTGVIGCVYRLMPPLPPPHPPPPLIPNIVVGVRGDSSMVYGHARLAMMNRAPQ